MTVRHGATSFPPVGPLPRGWWAPGLTLAERAEPPVPPPEPGFAGTPTESVTEDALARVARWRAAFGPGNRFDRRLAAVGLDEAGLARVVAEPRDSLAARTERPAWADVVEDAVRAAEPSTVEDTDWRAAFAVALRPFAVTAAENLTARAEAEHVDLPAIVARFTSRLSATLVGLATRTLVHELAVGLDAGTLTRPADLATRLTAPDRLAELFVAYPVLARLLARAAANHTDATVELLARFAGDRAAIVAELLDGVDPGRLTEIRFGLGDTHRGGRSVAILRFADGRRVVYKPRDLRAPERFSAVVHRLDAAVPGLDLRTVAVLPRDGYGFTEHVAHRPVAHPDAANLFYRRQGALLALLHAMHASDIHYENVIACGDQPVVVDVETLFHPTLAGQTDVADPAGRMRADSVLRTGLLPRQALGEDSSDVSGLCGGVVENVVTDWEPDERGGLRVVRRTVATTGQNRPRAGGAALDVRHHEAALLDGFRIAYDAVVRHRAEFTELVASCADVEVRVAVRNSMGYANLLAESTRPELLRDGLARDETLDLLWTESAGHPVRWRVCRYEQADLWALDVPMFTARPASTDLLSSDRSVLPGALDRAGLANAMDKLDAMGEVDRRDQEWIIAAALAARAPAGGHLAAETVPGPVTGTAATPERLLVAACALADRIVARTLTDGDRVNWLGLEPVEDRQWLVLPSGAGLANGFLGVALFLAQVTELSGIDRYAEVAGRALRGLPLTLAALADRPELVAAVGCGGLHGFGGIAYGLARLTTLLGDRFRSADELRDTTRSAVELAAVAARSPGGPGIATGGAGCLAAMTAVHAELGLPEAAALAEASARGLAGLVRRTDGRCGADTTGGFADGVAGVAWALSGHDRSAADLAAARAHAEPGNLGWCSGVAGLAAAGVGDGAPFVEDRPVSRDLSLCHGELGTAEALTVRARDPEHAAAARRRAGLVLDALNRYGPTCGTPGGLPTPGLLTGLAGIGYGLLRLGFPGRVPSVLLLEPSYLAPQDDNPRRTTKGSGSRV